VSETNQKPIAVDSPAAFHDRELSWLAFARRVLAQIEDTELALLERLKFAGIMGMLHDEFFMKRIGGLKRKIRKGSSKLSLNGCTATEQLEACQAEIRDQVEILARALEENLLPALAAESVPIRRYLDLEPTQQATLREYFRSSVQPILTPLAVDAEHPFPFISNDSLNLAVQRTDRTGQKRFVRIKLPDNRPRWVPLEKETGFVPLEEVIAENLDLMFSSGAPDEVHLFRVTRGAEGEPVTSADFAESDLQTPGSIVRQVSAELKARRFAGAVRLQVSATMPKKMEKWIAKQLEIGPEDIYHAETLLGVKDLLELTSIDRPDLKLPRHTPVTHPRLRYLPPGDSAAIFEEIARGDILVHHPYDSFDTSVLRFIESAAQDPNVLAIKLTIYRTNKDSPIVQALARASRLGKQVAVLVEITARFDEAPNIAWGTYLENEGVHVAYGVEKLKTHVKLALVVREEGGQVRRYAHVGTGNYHSGTARIYEDLGILTCHQEICEDVAGVFNQLTGATYPANYEELLVAPVTMRDRFLEMIRREAEHAENGREAGIRAKMNQLQDPPVISELYKASQAGVPIDLNIRGLCCLRPGVPGLSENIRVFGVIGRFLEHSRIYRFANGGNPEHYIGSADWMHRNLTNRVETIMQVLDPKIQAHLDAILTVYEEDNCSAWDAQPDGSYERRKPADGEIRRASQETFIALAGELYRPEDVTKALEIEPTEVPVPVDEL
jgi:polyphosphate kinase